MFSSFINMFKSPSIFNPSWLDIDSFPFKSPFIDSKSTCPEIFSNFPFKGVLLKSSFEIANSSILKAPLILDSFSK